MTQRNTVAMTRCSGWLCNLPQLVCTLLTLLADGMRSLGLCLRPSPTFGAEHLLRRRQLALDQERRITLRQTTHALHMVLVWLGRMARDNVTWGEEAHCRTTNPEPKDVSNGIQ
jgi:hypothetical protein